MDADRYLTQDEARQLYAAVESAHDFDHVLRVAQLGVRIGQVEGADVTVVRLAALLHDAPAPGGERRDHHLAAAAFAGSLLRQRGLAAGRVANVVHCIETHRFRSRTTEPATLEARCLYDADKLESIGAIGVARVFAYAGAHGSRLWTTPAADTPPIHEKPVGVDYTPVHEFVYKLERILPTLFTATAKTLGGRRHAYMLTFFEQLDAEMRGLV